MKRKRLWASNAQKTLLKCCETHKSLMVTRKKVSTSRNTATNNSELGGRVLLPVTTYSFLEFFYVLWSISTGSFI
jgi:hypothetical protein